MAIEKVIDIVVNTKDATKGIDGLNKSIKETDNSTKDLQKTSSKTKESLEAIGGGKVLAGFNALKGGLKGVASGFKSIGTAIALSGIGLLVVSVIALKTAFTASEEGQNKFAKIMGVIGALTGNLIDIISDLGEAIIWVFENPQKAIKKFADLIKENITNRIEGLLELIPALGRAVQKVLSGDFAEAGKIATDSIGKVTLGVNSLTDSINKATQSTKEFIDEQLREAKIAGQIADQRAQADKIDRKLITEKAETERKITELRGKSARQDLFNAKQRKAFLTEASALNDEITQKELWSARLKAKAIQEENKLSKSTKEDLDKQAEAEANVIRLETKRLNLQKRLGTEISSINQQTSAQSKKAREDKQKQIDDEIKAEETRLNKILGIQAKLVKSQEDLDADTAEKKLELQKERAQAELDLLIGTETEKQEAQLALNELFNKKSEQLIEKQKEKKAEKDAEERDALLEKQLEYAENEAIAFEERRLLLDERARLIAEDATLTDDQRTKAEAENVKARVEISKQETDAKQKAVNAIGDTLATASKLLGESTTAGKVAAVSATTIDTIQSGVSAYKGMVAAIPGPVGIAAGAVAAAGSLASGYASVKKILSVKTPNGGGGGGSVPSGGTPSAPASNLVGNTGTNQIQDTIEQDTTPIQAVVVSSAVTSAQEADRNAIEGATLG